MYHTTTKPITDSTPPDAMRRVPFAVVSIGQMFIFHGTVHVKKSTTQALNCQTLKRIKIAEPTKVEIA